MGVYHAVVGVDFFKATTKPWASLVKTTIAPEKGVCVSFSMIIIDQIGERNGENGGKKKKKTRRMGKNGDGKKKTGKKNGRVKRETGETGAQMRVHLCVCVCVCVCRAILTAILY